MACNTCTRRSYDMLHKTQQREWRVKRRKELFKIWSNHVRIRDGKCLLCGSVERLQAHHLFSKQFYKGIRYDIINGITVCASCHRFKGATEKGSFHHSPIPNVKFKEAYPDRWEYLMEHYNKDIDYENVDILIEMCVPMRRNIGYWKYKEAEH